jgi:ribosomal protein S19
VHNTIFNCNLIIPKSLVDCEIFIYNGKFVETLNIKSNMIGFRLGDFCFTKVMGKDVTARKKAKLLKKRMKKKKNKFLWDI